MTGGSTQKRGRGRPGEPPAANPGGGPGEPTPPAPAPRAWGPRFWAFIHPFYWRGSGLSSAIKMRVAPAGWLAVGLLVVAAAMGVDTNRSASYQVFTLLLALLVVGAIQALFFRASVHAERTLPRFASVGVPFTYRVRLRNLGRRRHPRLTLREWFPDPRPDRETFVHNPEPGESRRNAFDRTFVAYRWMWLAERARGARSTESSPFGLPAGGVAEVDLTLEPVRRGALHLGDLRLLRGDIFGFFKGTRRAAVGGPDTLTVLPRRYPVPPLDLGGRARYQPGGVALASSIGQSEEFVGLRDYRPGDPMRHLHWKSWARTGEPIVKQFADEFFSRYALALDTMGAPGAGEGADAVFEEAVSVAASFAYALDSRDSLLDLLFVGDRPYAVTAGRGVAPAEHLLEVLAGVGPAPTTPFAALRSAVMSHAREVSAAICVLTAWDEPRQDLLADLRARGQPVLGLVVLPPGAGDDDAAQPPAAPGVHFLVAGRVAEGLAGIAAGGVRPPGGPA